LSAGAAPAGSYAQTCRDVTAEPARLYATCQARDGHWVTTSLASWRACRGDIANIDGRLSCTARSYPSGSYAQTCRGVKVARGALLASCETRDGRWTDTRLGNVAACRGDISNEDGSLTCPR
jgi:hypothetical protein